MSNLAHMLSALDTEIERLLLVTADAAADEGDAELEAGLRWLARKGKWPTRVWREPVKSGRGKGRWSWCWEIALPGAGSHLSSDTLPWACFSPAELCSSPCFACGQAVRAAARVAGREILAGHLE